VDETDVGVRGAAEAGGIEGAEEYVTHEIKAPLRRIVTRNL
jgi:hypothetical protein